MKVIKTLNFCDLIFVFWICFPLWRKLFKLVFSSYAVEKIKYLRFLLSNQKTVLFFSLYILRKLKKLFKVLAFDFFQFLRNQKRLFCAFFPPFIVTYSDNLAVSKSTLEAAQAYSFSIHPLFLNTVSEAALGNLPFTVRYLFVIYGTTYSRIGCQVLPTQPIPRKAEDFLLGDKYFNHVPLLTYPIYFPPKVLLGEFYLYFRVCYRTLYWSVTCFEPTAQYFFNSPAWFWCLYC